MLLASTPQFVVLAKAGIYCPAGATPDRWIPAFVAMKKSSAAGAERGVPNVGALLGDAGLFVADPGKTSDALADLLLRSRAKAQPQPRLGCLAVAGPFRPGIERDAGIEGGLYQLSDIDLIGQFQPQEDAAFRGPRLDRGAEFALHRFDHRVELALQRLAQLVDMVLEMRREILGDDHLFERADAAVALALDRDHAAHELPIGDDVAEAQRRGQGFRERADMDDVA